MKQIINRLKTLSVLETFSVLMVLSLTMFIVKYFSQKKETLFVRVEVIKKNWQEGNDPYGYRVPFWISDKLKIGQVEKSSTGKITATLVNMENYERGSEEADIYLILKLVVTKNNLTGQYSYKTRPLNLGSPISLNLNNIAISGQIIDNNYPSEGYPTKEFSVTALARNLFPATFSKVKPGLKMYNRANGKQVAEITNVKLENSSIQSFSSINGTLTATTSENRDMYITVKLTAQQIDGDWFFAGHQNLKPPYSLYLFLDSTNIFGIEIQDVKAL